MIAAETLPLISVTMNCLNGEKYLREAIDSVYAQTYPRWEIIFWDNASTDKTAEIAKSYDNRLRYFRGEETIPLGAARNRALDQVRGDYIAFLDCDDIWEPDKLQLQLETLIKDKSLGLVYTDVININENLEQPICKLSEKLNPVSGYVFYDIFDGVYINPSMAMIPKSVLSEVGNFNESYNFVEESEFFLRIAYKFYFAYIDKPLTIYRFHENNESARFVERHKEVLRYRADLLISYPDILIHKPNLQKEWTFNHYARLFRWYLRNKDWRLIIPLAKLLLISFRLPGYAMGRMKIYFLRSRGKLPITDWI